jgi:hypothetical protein
MKAGDESKGIFDDKNSGVLRASGCKIVTEEYDR